jgi:hypothetical protein
MGSTRRRLQATAEVPAEQGLTALSARAGERRLSARSTKSMGTVFIYLLIAALLVPVVWVMW